MVTIKFIKEFAGKKKGDILKCDGMLASQLVRIDKVAKYEKSDNKKAR